MMMPSRLCLGLIGVLLVTAFLSKWIAWLTPVTLLGMTTLAVLSLIDAVMVKKPPALRIERQMQHIWPVEVWHTVTLKCVNEGKQTRYAEIYDHYPLGWAYEGLPHKIKLQGDSFVQFSYRLQAQERGKHQFAPAHVRVHSFFHLWEHIFRIGDSAEVKVFPNYSQVLGKHLIATDRRSPTAGSIRKRRRGEGTDFRQLRDWRRGDSLRSVDWKATARQQKPITREYQEERDQQVVFLLDTGRRMLAKDGATSHFDHALNAILTLGFIAQKQGDAIGFMNFGGEARWISPQKGRFGLDRLLTHTYDLQAQEVAPDYMLAASALMQRLHKRAFVVLITNVRDEDDESLKAACQLISSKHLVLCASLREKHLDAVLTQKIQNFNDALRYSATIQYLSQRDEAIRRLGLPLGQLIDIVPEHLSQSLVNRYLDIKESGAL